MITSYSWKSTESWLGSYIGIYPPTSWKLTTTFSWQQERGEGGGGYWVTKAGLILYNLKGGGTCTQWYTPAGGSASSCALLVGDFRLGISVSVIDHSVEGLVDPLTSNHLKSGSVCVCTCVCVCTHTGIIINMHALHVLERMWFPHTMPKTECMMTA